MSTGGSIPYHLRQNKAIERNLFVDLLNRVGRYQNISESTYIGFGGPFLEDFKHLHASLRIGNMISLEIDEDVFKRQLFNQPISCIDLNHQSSADFITNYDFNDPVVVWLDYATPEIGEQLIELQRLVEKLGPGDIFKITLNAHPQTLGGKPGPNLHEQRAEEAFRRLGDYGPAQVTEDDVKPKNYPKLLLDAILSSAKKGIRGGPGYIVQPLASFVYSDGMQMLTFTGIVLNATDKEKFIESTRLNHWKFSDLTGEKQSLISVPAFSIKERLHVESMLPEKSAATILDSLGFFIGEKDSATQLMENFVQFYRVYPWYSRIIV